MRLSALIRQDVKYQFRNSIHLIYMILVVLYIIAIRLLPVHVRVYVGIFTILTDTGVLGYFFIGAVVMFERNEQLFEALFTTPVTIKEYILSKAISFSFLAAGCSLLIYVFSAPVSLMGIVLVLAAVLLCTLLFTVLGIGVAVIAPSLNHYFMYSIAFSALMAPPVLEYFGLFSNWLVYLTPLAGVLHILHTAYNGGADFELVIAFLSLVPWIAVSLIVVSRKLNELISMRIGEHSWIKL